MRPQREKEHFPGRSGHAGIYCAARGIPVDAVARRMNNALFDSYLNQARRDVGMTVVYDNEAVRRILAVWR